MLLLLNVDVTVSLQATQTVGEGDRMIQVCSTLATLEEIERDLIVKLNTSDNTGL